MQLGKLMSIAGIVIGCIGQLITTIDTDKQTEKIIREQVDRHFKK